MSELNFDLDSRLSCLESEWHQACETSRVAGEEIAALSSGKADPFADVQRARARLAHAEQMKYQVMAKIERLELVVMRKFGPG